MKVVLQRVSESRVHVDGQLVGAIRKGFNILLGVAKGDNKEDVHKLVKKICNLRIFQDSNEKMNLSIMDIGAEVLVISQFTLLGNVKKGRRPSFDGSADPSLAEELYEYFIECLKEEGLHVQCGRFGAMMDVHICNDGPVTFVIDSHEL